MAEQIEVTGVCYDRSVNRTFAVVRTREFTSTFYVSGQVAKDKFIDWVRPTVERMLEDFPEVSHA